MKRTDPGLEPIRRVRHRISAGYAHGPKRLIEHYEKLQKKYSDRIIDHAPAEAPAGYVEDR